MIYATPKTTGIPQKVETFGWKYAKGSTFPEDFVKVKIIYKSYYDDELYNDALAYIEDGKWKWANDNSEIKVDVLAWKGIS